MNHEIVKLEQGISNELQQIEQVLKDGSVNIAYKKYMELVKKIESFDGQLDRSLVAGVYASLAFFLFEQQEYDYFFKMLIKAQSHGYPGEQLEGMLWEVFIEPNVAEYQSNYEKNARFLLQNGYLGQQPLTFEELPFWLMPNGAENEFYMYDKKRKLISDKISLYKLENKSLQLDAESLSDYLLIDEWEWENITTLARAANGINKKAYVILENIGKFLSCLQGALLFHNVIFNAVIFDSISGMQQYFLNNNAYLPKKFINLSSSLHDVQSCIKEIQAQRNRKEHRKGDNILLSICIPTYNRGKRALDNVTQLLQAMYDEEIEIVVSNNGSKNETKAYYDQLKQIDDARLTYFEFEDNQGVAANFCKVSELASGRFILLLSDEDQVDLSTLERIMAMLYSSKETLAILRTSTMKQGRPPAFRVAQAGNDALLTFMLTSNYMSGIIFNNDLLKKHNATTYVKENLANTVCFFYPHMYWELLLCQYGNVQGTEVILIREGQAEKTELEVKEIGDGDLKIPHYATIEGRFEQHRDFHSIFMGLELCQKDTRLLRKMYYSLCAKTLWLVSLSFNFYYIKTQKHSLQEMLDKTLDYCLNRDFVTFGGRLSSTYASDANEIRRFYANFKKQVGLK